MKTGLVAGCLVVSAMLPLTAPLAQQCVHPEGNVAFGTWGDVDASGTVNVADALCLVLSTLSVSANPLQPVWPACLAVDPVQADVNCSGVVTISDILLVVTESLSSVFSISGGCPAACAGCAPAGLGSCLIGAQCVPEGTAQPGDPCSACWPTSSAKTWTASPNGEPCGANSVCSAGQCVPAGPASPSGVVASQAGDQIHVLFEYPEAAPPATSFEVTCTPDVGPALSVTGTSSPLLLSGAAGGATYTCIARAGVGDAWSVDSEPSNPLSFTGGGGGGGSGVVWDGFDTPASPVVLSVSSSGTAPWIYQETEQEWDLSASVGALRQFRVRHTEHQTGALVSQSGVIGGGELSYLRTTSIPGAYHDDFFELQYDNASGTGGIGGSSTFDVTGGGAYNTMVLRFDRVVANTTYDVGGVPSSVQAQGMRVCVFAQSDAMYLEPVADALYVGGGGCNGAVVASGFDVELEVRYLDYFQGSSMGFSPYEFECDMYENGFISEMDFFMFTGFFPGDVCVGSPTLNLSTFSQLNSLWMYFDGADEVILSEIRLENRP